MRDALKTRQLPRDDWGRWIGERCVSDVLFNPLDSYITKIPIYIHSRDHCPARSLGLGCAAEKFAFRWWALGLLGCGLANEALGLAADIAWSTNKGYHPLSIAKRVVLAISGPGDKSVGLRAPMVPCHWVVVAGPENSKSETLWLIESKVYTTGE